MIALVNAMGKASRPRRPPLNRRICTGLDPCFSPVATKGSVFDQSSTGKDNCSRTMLGRERTQKRSGLGTKARLADVCAIAGTAVRRIFTTADRDQNAPQLMWSLFAGREPPMSALGH